MKFKDGYLYLNNKRIGKIKTLDIVVKNPSFFFMQNKLNYDITVDVDKAMAYQRYSCQIKIVETWRERLVRWFERIIEKIKD